MVFFTCNACGESVKKVQVEKHVAICRNCECLSCIDCGKDFWGDDYKNHVKCISEEQKYGGKGYEGKTHKGDIKQQAWIQKINELIKRPNVSPKVRELLEQISGFDNVPRKKAKFQNWMKNSLKVHNESILEQVWNIFSEASSNEAVSKGQDRQPLTQAVSPPRAELSAKVPASGTSDSTEKQAEVKKNKRERKEERQKNRKKEKKELKLENHQENSKNQKPKKHKTAQAAGGEALRSAGKKSQRKVGEVEGAADRAKDGAGACAGDAEEEPTKARPAKRKQKHLEDDTDYKKKKRKFSGPPQGGEPENHEAPTKGKFNWKGTIKAVLRQAPDNEVAIKKLRKKVLAQYYAVTNEHHKSEEELLTIFNKKISKNPTFKLLKDKVKLLK
ncbi:cell growth-regulating nucleolar protein [Mustela nigripes]|uniref:cell growth-regulating nucleolar protein n=1 Tax=Mustela nigripes TaxID=77151 RepID=UPI00281579B2|nr:cell growth-regulating nucleolar protein [Mustela nigripes]XP_059236777.1 cell growth-regulating nucleolar protein [Mustela nigripes]XP_059236788.1 cell growth-regulating nucleolar protein [Mustela nigripes]